MEVDNQKKAEISRFTLGGGGNVWLQMKHDFPLSILISI